MRDTEATNLVMKLSHCATQGGNLCKIVRFYKTCKFGRLRCQNKYFAFDVQTHKKALKGLWVVMCDTEATNLVMKLSHCAT